MYLLIRTSPAPSKHLQSTHTFLGDAHAVNTRQHLVGTLAVFTCRSLWKHFLFPTFLPRTYCLNHLGIAKTPIAAVISHISQSSPCFALRFSSLLLLSEEPGEAGEAPCPAAHGPFHRLIGSQREICPTLRITTMLFLLLALYYSALSSTGQGKTEGQAEQNRETKDGYTLLPLQRKCVITF